MKTFIFCVCCLLLLTACQKDKELIDAPSYTTLGGLYNAESTYFHPTQEAPYIHNVVRYIELVEIEGDVLTYNMDEIGQWENQEDNDFYFYVDAVTGNIDIPEFWDGEIQTVWDTDPLINCNDHAASMINVSCINKVSFEEDGKPIINISYGYARSNGAREFEDILIRQL